MKRSDFFYHLPESLIAQEPMEPRDQSRMMVLKRENQEISHHIFREIPDFIPPDTMLVVNDTKVFPARLHLDKAETGARIELFLLKQMDSEARTWRALIRPAKRVKKGTVLAFPDNSAVEITDVLNAGIHIVRFESSQPFELINRYGETPLPPYIKRAAENPDDRERYQTVFAKNIGAVAAPTAGFHFTPDLLKKLEEKNIPVSRVTLTVGLGTFRPVKADDIRDHQMDTESYEITKETANAINNWKKQGGRILAVGTTSVRTLEGCYQKYGEIKPVRDETDIFIYPPHRFNLVDFMLTNFHLPESTLIMLVSAFAGKDFVFEAYRQAVKGAYRFYSYGDCMLIL
ncbi:MAG: tRNA preQ1(34) S-adenosylmethionine ribosyltransferase-isomerase QueA [Acidobacteria bacterium]|nr:MAG: tRNA preQ1(34) S-adenosylmethionine ribosyltransferase-isomerase QueA [Acidobacteriota bacterium]RLE24713.1 MAG: tRNA preQ1(34) S-adenosylmethionine ribosyltransferase-isomerase QueA [Acidobacteriota bacterium]